MQTADLKIVEDIRNSLFAKETTETVDAVTIYSPAEEVEASLVGFLKHRLAKLQEASSYEDKIKEVIFSRIGEASFPHLITLLEILQKNNNIATEKVLAPFIARTEGEGGFLSPTKGMRTANLDDKLFAETNDKKILQGIAALSQLLDIIQSPKPGSDQPPPVGSSDSAS